MLESIVFRGKVPNWIELVLDLNLPKKRPEIVNLIPLIFDFEKFPKYAGLETKNKKRDFKKNKNERCFFLGRTWKIRPNKDKKREFFIEPWLYKEDKTKKSINKRYLLEKRVFLVWRKFRYKFFTIFLLIDLFKILTFKISKRDKNKELPKRVFKLWKELKTFF